MIEFLSQYIGMPNLMVSWFANTPGADIGIGLAMIMASGCICQIFLTMASFEDSPKGSMIFASYGLLTAVLGMLFSLVFISPLTAHYADKQKNLVEIDIMNGKQLSDGRLILAPTCEVVGGKAYWIVREGAIATERCP